MMRSLVLQLGIILGLVLAGYTAFSLSASANSPHATQTATKAELLATFDEVKARLPRAEAAELEKLRPQFEALDDSVLAEAATSTAGGQSIASTMQSATSQTVLSSGDLEVAPSTSLSCPNMDLLFTKGQQVVVSGDGFASNAPVEVKLELNDFLAQLGTFSSDSGGNIAATVTIPTGDFPDYPAQTVALLQASGASPDGTRWLSTMVTIATPTGDDDSDGVPNHCDNCPGTSNPTQQDQDDDIGDACDPCPAGKDSDGDGQCDNVDPCKFDPLNDEDGDGVCGDIDNCPAVHNSDQSDSNGDGIGDACAPDGSACEDGIDNDGDGRIDHHKVSSIPDPGCSKPNDDDEMDEDHPCDDGIDNDGDGYVDFRLDSTVRDRGCASPASPTENPQCSDGVDNDGDGRYDADGYFGVFGLDYDCGGDPSHNDEAVPVPEPTKLSLLAVGTTGLIAMSRSRERRGCYGDSLGCTR